MLKMKKCHFSSLQTILNSRAEYPLKTDISIGTFNEHGGNTNFAIFAGDRDGTA